MISQEQAQHRSRYILQNSIKYNFHIVLRQQIYQGYSEIKFSLNEVCDALFIDCSSKNILRFVVNGSIIQNYEHIGSHLYLPQKYLVKGVNHVCLLYLNVYDNDERGLMIFTDVDQKQYLYTQFEAYYAHRVFGLFDQPDLKAKMKLTIVCPIQWTSVISNEQYSINEKFELQKYLNNCQFFNEFEGLKYLSSVDSSGLRMVFFPETKQISTYLYCFLAGSYEQIVLNPYKNIPMSIYCSSAKLPYVKKMVPYLQQITVQCMKFFQEFFGTPYAFSKYDQAFVHEMQAYAMENCGIVTYDDSQYIWTDKVTSQKMLDLADTMSHELAHHWFGNLTTMKWWDDLWLNQSFAEFIAHYALEKIQSNLKLVKFESSMAQFLGKKQVAFRDDKSVITHPIRGDVKNSAVAESIFDGITYEKGAATLKQLVYLMGDTNFSLALKSYFNKFAYKNTTLSDFIQCLREQISIESSINLTQWSKIWLQKASLNELEPLWWDQSDGSDKRILTIKQRPYTENYPTIRSHKIKIAFFRQDCTFDIVEAMVEAQNETRLLIETQKSKDYCAILLNYEDFTFAKIIFDRRSQNFFIKNILKIEDLLTRTLIWINFCDMVVDGLISTLRYIDLFINNIRQEPSDALFQKNYQYLIKFIKEYTPIKYRQQISNRIFYFTLETLKMTPNLSENRIITLQTSLNKLASSQLSKITLLRWLQRKQASLIKFQLSINDKWEIIRHAFSLDVLPIQKKKNLLSQQLQLDSSERAKLQTKICEAIICSEDQFLQIYQSIFDPSSNLTIYAKRLIIEGLFIGKNSLRMEKIKKKFFVDIEKAKKVLSMEHLTIIIMRMYPQDDCLKQTIQEFNQLLKDFSQQSGLTKVNTKILSLVDTLEKRNYAYETFFRQINE